MATGCVWEGREHPGPHLTSVSGGRGSGRLLGSDRLRKRTSVPATKGGQGPVPPPVPPPVVPKTLTSVHLMTHLRRTTLKRGVPTAYHFEYDLVTLG